MSPNCPDRPELAAFQAGKLTDDDLTRVAEHVEACASCQTVLQSDTTCGDPLVAELKQAPPADVYAEESGCRRIVSRIKALGAGDGTNTCAEPAAAAALPALTMLGKYQLLEPIGQGGMGTVYKAVHTLLKRTVAVKVLPPDRLRSPQAVNRFRREIEAAGRLEHPHIVRTSDAGEADGQHFLVMEWLAGQDLTKVVQSQGPLPLDLACAFIRQAALGLDCAHKSGMVHRDVKPANLLLTTGAEGQPLIKVLDLGLALFHDHVGAPSGLTSVGQVMGTYDFIAPEQAMESHTVDARADMYSLGCTFYFLLTGRTPFQGKSEMKKLLAHQLEEPLPMSQYRNDVPHEVNAMVAKMMAKDPARRFASMGELADALETWCPGRHVAGRGGPGRSAAETVVAHRRKPAGIGARHYVGRCLVVLALVMVPLVALYGAMIFRFVTNQGELVIEVNDPAVEVKIVHNGLVVQDKPSERVYTLTVGKGTIDVVEKDGIKLATRQFELTRGVTTRVRVTLEELAAARRPKIERKQEPPRPDLDEDRKAAKWVLSLGGNVTLHMRGNERQIEADGTLPEERFELRGVDLHDNEDVGDAELARLQGCASLTSLDLNGTQVGDAGLAQLKNCKNLVNLWLRQANVTDAGLAHLKECKNLMGIDLSKTAITSAGLAHLKEFKKLAWLYLTDTQVDDGGLAHLKEHTDLNEVYLAKTKVTAVGLAYLKGCKKLTALYVDNTEVGDAGLLVFKDCKDLVYLGLTNSKVSDKGLVHFKDRTNVLQLWLGGTAIGDAGLAVFKHCKELTDLDLTETKVSDAGLVHFKDCRELNYLSLQSTSVTDMGLEHFKDCKKLATLWLDSPKVGNDGLAHFKDCTGLTELYLSNSRVTDAGLALIKDCTGLTKLQLADTMISDAGLATLVRLGKLAELDLGSTRVSLRGQKQLKAALPNCEITWSEPNRLVAEQVLALGGKVAVAPPHEPDAKMIKTAKELSAELFQVRRIGLRGVTKPLDELIEQLGRLRFPEFDGLAFVDLSGIAKLDYDFLANVHGLRDLTLADAGLNDLTLAKLPKLPALKRLVLDGNDIHGPGLAHLATFPELVDLSLGCPSLTDALARHLAQLKQLQRLSLADSGLTDAAVKHLESLPNLEWLDLRRTKVTDQGVAALRKALPKVTVLK